MHWAPAARRGAGDRSGVWAACRSAARRELEMAQAGGVKTLPARGMLYCRSRRKALSRARHRVRHSFFSQVDESRWDEGTNGWGGVGLWGILLHLVVAGGSWLYRRGSGIVATLEGLGESCFFSYLRLSHILDG